MPAARQLPVALEVMGPHSLLASAGTLVIFLVIFAETGLLIAFFLPGDSLLFTAGVLCTTGPHAAVHLSLRPVLLAAAAGALTGAQAGYFIGTHAGRRLLDRAEPPRLAAGISRARDGLDRYGIRRAVVLARFIPVVRTAVSPVAGATRVPVLTFTVWQVVGGLTWSLGITMAGDEIGSRISGIGRYLLPVVALIVVVSLIRRGGQVTPADTPGRWPGRMLR
jgi:membrane-associated protein